MRKTPIIPVRLIQANHDTDWDGVPNYRDCEPFNPRKQDAKNSKIYPDADASEVIAKATKSSVGPFCKQYKKRNFIYTIEKRPFREMAIVAVHEPTKKVFAYSKYFLEWNDVTDKIKKI